MKKLLLFIILLFISFQVFSQKKHIKYGKVSDEEINMTIYDKDSSANAVIIFKYGDGSFQWDENTFHYVLNVHIRIKILKTEGLDLANIELPYSIEYDNISRLKAASYNKSGTTKLKNKDIFTEKYNNKVSIKKFSIPNVTVGSVIEYSYVLTTDALYSLDRWYFQEDIPTIYNELVFFVPEYYDYRTNIKGYLNINNINSKISEKILIQISQYSVKQSKNLTQDYYLNSLSKKTIYWIENAPAFKEEPYTTNKKNYLSCIDFELLRIKNFDDLYTNYSTSWEELNSRLTENEYFGKQINCTPSIKKQVELIIADKENDYDKMIAIYEWVKNNIAWNKKNRLYTENNINKTFKDGKGNSAEINILLITMLKEAKIFTIPVILSTRDNGFITPSYPSISDFNYVIAFSTVNGKEYYLDATEKYAPAGLLPFRCINGISRTIGPNSKEIDITGNKKSIIKNFISIELKDEKLIGKYGSIRDNYAALNYRAEYIHKTSEENFIDYLEETYSGMSITDFIVENLNDYYKNLKIKYNFEISDKIDILGDKIYFNPMLYWGEEENPFKIEDRKYPVDFAYPRETSYFLTFTIPDEYVIETIPEPQIITLPDNTANFTYNVVNIGNMIQVSSKLSFNKSIYSQDEYSLLKQFFSLIVKKHSEQIVLKKKE